MPPTHVGLTVVQFAQKMNKDGTAMLCALKFFAHLSEYEEEVEAYAKCSKKLRSFMPQVLECVDNKDGAIKSPVGTTVLPFMVMEKGESLRDRAGHMEVELLTAAQVRPPPPPPSLYNPLTVFPQGLSLELTAQ